MSWQEQERRFGSLQFGDEGDQQQAPAKRKKNFWLDQISTITGTLGGIGGGVLGAGAAGVGAVPGAIGGGAAGSALGEAIENALQGNTRILDNVGKEAVLGGVFAGGPLKIAGAGGRAVLGAGAKKAASTAVTTAGREIGENVAPQILKTSFRGKAGALGNKALASQYGTIGKPVARANNPLDTIGELANYGITKPVDAERIAASITGGNGILNNAVATAVTGAGKVSTRGVRGTLKNAIVNNGLVDKDAKAVTNIVTSQLRSLGSTSAEPKAVLGVMKNLEKRAANLQGKGGNYGLATPERIDQAKALLNVRDDLQERLYKIAGGDKNLPSVLTPQLREELVQLHPGNAQWQGFVDNNIMQAKNIKSLRSAQAPFVRIGNIIKEGDINSMTFGGRAGDAFNGGTIPAALMNGARQVVKNPVARGVSRPLRAIGGNTGGGIERQLGFGSKAIMQPSSRRGFGGITNRGITSRMATQGVGRGLFGNPAPDVTDESQPTTLDQALIQAGQGGSFEDTTVESTNPYSRENLMADINRDPTNAQDYIQYYSMLEEVFNPQPEEVKPLTGEAQKRALTSESGLRSLDTLDQYAQSDPGAFQRQALPNPFGITARATGTTDVRAATDNVIDVLARLRSGAAITEDEAARFARLLPQPGDSQESAMRKLQNVRAELQSFSQNPGGGGSLEDALMQYQQQGGYR